MVAAAVPFLPGFSFSRVFYLRDLSIFFWGQHLFLRRELLSGEFPLWDPYVAGGQSAAANALRQMFFPPAVALRLLGNEAFGFNIYVAAPFPVAALGAWLFFRRRYSEAASALGAVAFAASGPIVSTSNFPNMSWSIAAMPWVLWAADRLVASGNLRTIAGLAVAVACQALAGEPVTLLATLALTTAYVLTFAAPARPRVRCLTSLACGVALGLAVAAVQLLPLAQAAAGSKRAAPLATSEFWSLHPIALLETVSSPGLFGDFYSAQNLRATPWFPVLNSGREPFLLSLYFGVPLVTVATFGFLSRSVPRWTAFWIAAAAASLVGAFGAYTPIYPFVKAHVPVLGSFRFPVKYFSVVSLAIAAGAAAGWDAVNRERAAALERARSATLAIVAVIGAAAALVAAGCMYAPTWTAFRLFDIARALGVADAVGAAEFMLKTLPRQASWVLLLSAATAALFFLADRARKTFSYALGGLIVVDLVVRAWGICPAFDVARMAEPEWVAYMRSDPNARFYVGSKTDGTIDAADLDASGPIWNPAGLTGSASRAAVNATVNCEPSPWRSREMLSYDLAILWPRDFHDASDRFFVSPRQARDLFLDRTGVRYRILPKTQAGGRAPLTRIPLLYESYLYDFDGNAAPRVELIPEAMVVSDVRQQIDALFDPRWNARTLALVDRESAPSGAPGAPAAPAASIVSDAANRVVVDASASAGGGYVMLRDTYTDDWRARVDGESAPMVRADGLFRAVRLTPGRHRIEFVYRPRAVIAGGIMSAIALGVVAVCGVRRPRVSTR